MSIQFVVTVETKSDRSVTTFHNTYNYVYREGMLRGAICICSFMNVTVEPLYLIL